jgi:hypothetical protein
MRGISTNGAGYTDPNRFYYLGPSSSSVWPPAYNIPSSLGFRYQILRQPRRVGNPLEMPAGTCVDIEHSGMGPTGYDTPGVDVTVDGGFGEATSRLIVLFQPSGGIDGLYVDNQAIVPTGTLHFLVGRVDKVFLPTGPNPAHPSGFNAFALETSNLADANNVWVSVGRLNGSITTSENMPDSEHGTLHANPWTAAGQAEYLEECRQVATGREQMGGQ